jgi:hypothetical protein
VREAVGKRAGAERVARGFAAAGGAAAAADVVEELLAPDGGSQAAGHGLLRPCTSRERSSTHSSS